jgi:isoleucyl-tRNA synthetase
MSRLHSLIEHVDDSLERYQIHDAFLSIMNFVVRDFSRNYIKMIRDREDTREIIGEVLKTVSLLLAPFAPYISEYVFQSFEKESVHLSRWPMHDKKHIDKKLENSFAALFTIIEKGLAERDKIKIGLKWPLALARIQTEETFPETFAEILKNQLNVKRVDFISTKEKEISVSFDTTLTPELEAEGYAREISRKIQASRKHAGFVKSDLINLEIISDGALKKMLELQKEFIKARVNAKHIFITTRAEKKYKHVVDDMIKDKKIKIFFQKA